MFLTKKIMLKGVPFIGMNVDSDSPLGLSETFHFQTVFIFFLKNTHTGKPFMYVAAFDLDDPNTLHSKLSYSILQQFPSLAGTEMYFQIDNVTGAISTTLAGR